MTTSRGYRTLLGASTVSNLGDGVLLGALPLLTAQVTRDPLAVSGVTAFTWLPWLLFSLPVGVLVDRIDRRRSAANRGDDDGRRSLSAARSFRREGPPGQRETLA